MRFEPEASDGANAGTTPRTQAYGDSSQLLALHTSIIWRKEPRSPVFFLFFATRPPHCARPSSARQGEVPRGEVAPFCGVIACAPRSPLSRRRRREAGTHAAFLAALLRLPLAALLNGSGEPRRHLGHGRRRVHRGHRRPRGRCQARPRGQAQRRGRGAPQWPPARRQPGARCGRPLFLSYPLFPG